MAQLPLITVRLAQSDDIPHLRAVESSAATLLTTIPALAHHALDPPISPESLADFMAAKHLWVAITDKPATDTTGVIGFLAGYSFDDNSSFYLAELSVSASYQRIGVGALLIGTMCTAVQAEGLTSVVLVTYHDVPWNAPWYVKQGFVQVIEAECAPELTAILEEERESGNFEGASRCAMRKELGR